MFKFFNAIIRINSFTFQPKLNTSFFGQFNRYGFLQFCSSKDKRIPDRVSLSFEEQMKKLKQERPELFTKEPPKGSVPIDACSLKEALKAHEKNIKKYGVY